MLAGHDQSGGELIERNGKKYKLFYGMASKTAQTKHRGGFDSFSQNLGFVKFVYIGLWFRSC